MRGRVAHAVDRFFKWLSGWYERSLRAALTQPVLVMTAAVATFGIAAPELQTLIDGRLLRVEGRVNSQFYELSHDTLVAPIRSARVRRRMRTVAIMGVAYVALVSSRVVLPLVDEVEARLPEARQAR